MKIKDERMGLPSASSRERDFRCPGSRRLINSLVESGSILNLYSKDSISGDKVHDALETGDDSDLSHEETVSLEKIEEKIKKIKDAVGVPDSAEEVSEERLWLREGLKRIASGKADKVFRWDDQSLVIDAKSGWLPVVPSPENLQLRGLVVLEFANNVRTEKVTTVIVPANDALHVPVVYERDTTGFLALQEWKEHIRKSEEPDAPRIPGDHCRYCPAAQVAACEENRGVVVKTAATVVHVPGVEISNDDLKRFLKDFCGPAKKTIAYAESEAKRRLEKNPDAFGGEIILSNPRATEKIIDLPTVLSRVMNKGITAPEFTSKCTITKKGLQEMLGGKLEIKGKALNDAVKEAIKGAVEITYSKPSLKHVESTKAIEEKNPPQESIEIESSVEHPILQREEKANGDQPDL